MWPGDDSFSADKFGELGATYVQQALINGWKLHRQEMHDYELPIANLACLTANINRDTKRQRKPYQLKDFCFFQLDSGDNAPDFAPAAAYMALQKSGKLPTWALFVYSDMRHGDPQAATSPLAAIGDGVVVLSPIEKNGGLEGLLLARCNVSGKRVKVQLGKRRLTLAVPEFAGSYLAREHVYLPIMS